MIHNNPYQPHYNDIENNNSEYEPLNINDDNDTILIRIPTKLYNIGLVFGYACIALPMSIFDIYYAYRYETCSTFTDINNNIIKPNTYLKINGLLGIIIFIINVIGFLIKPSFSEFILLYKKNIEPIIKLFLVSLNIYGLFAFIDFNNDNKCIGYIYLYIQLSIIIKLVEHIRYFKKRTHINN